MIWGFYIPFTSLCAMNHRTVLNWNPPPAGFGLGTSWSSWSHLFIFFLFFIFFFFFAVVTAVFASLPHIFISVDKVKQLNSNTFNRVDSSTITLWTGPFHIKGVSGWFLLLSCVVKVSEFNANNVDPDQTLQSAVSDLGLYRLPVSFLRDTRLKSG